MNARSSLPCLLMTALLLVSLAPLSGVAAAPAEASEFYYGVEYDWNSVDTDLENFTGVDLPEILGEVMGAANDAGLNLILGQLQTGSSNIYVHHTENIAPQTIQDNDGNDVSVWSRTDDVTLRHGVLVDSILQTDWSETVLGAGPTGFDFDILQSLEHVLTVDMTYTEYLDDNSNLVGADMLFSMQVTAVIGLDIDALLEGGGEAFPIDFDSEFSVGYSIANSSSEWRLGSPDSIYVDLSSNDEYYWGCDDCGDITGDYTGTVDYSFSVNGFPTEDIGLDAGRFDFEVSDSLTNSGTFDMEAEGGYDFQMGDSMTVDLGDGEGVTTQVQSCESCPPGNPLMFMMMGHVLVGSGTAFAEQLVEDLGDGFEDGFFVLFFPYIWASNLAEPNTDEIVSLYAFDAEEASASPDDLVRVIMAQGMDLNWAAISVKISVNNGAPITCDNPGATGGSCGLVEFGDTSDQVWSVGDGVTIIETGQDLCVANETCSVTVTITDTQEGETLDVSSAVAYGRSMADDDVFICDNGNEIPMGWYDDGENDCGDGSDEPNMDPEAVFTCDNGNEIPMSWVEDLEDDCGDGSDEPNLPNPSEELRTIFWALVDSNLGGVLEQFGMNLGDRFGEMELFEGINNGIEYILCPGCYEESTDGNLMLYSFMAEDANGEPTDGIDDDLVRLTMTQGGDINWAAVSVKISVNNGAPITCDNPGATGGSCGLVEFGDTSDQVWSVGDGVTIKESSALCDAGQECYILATVTDTREGMIIDESSAEARSTSSGDSQFPYNDGMWAPLWSNEHAAIVGVGVYAMNDDGNYTLAGPETQGYTDDAPAKVSIRYLTGLNANSATNGMEDAMSIGDIVNVEEHNLDDIAEDLAAAGIDVGNLTLPQSSNSNATTGDENPTPPTAEELAEDAGLLPFLSPISMMAVIALAGVVAGSRRDEDQQVDE